MTRQLIGKKLVYKNPAYSIIKIYLKKLLPTSQKSLSQKFLHSFLWQAHFPKQAFPKLIPFSDEFQVKTPLIL